MIDCKFKDKELLRIASLLQLNIKLKEEYLAKVLLMGLKKIE